MDYKNRELLPGVKINPQIIKTKMGIVEYDLLGDPKKKQVVLVLHGGMGGCDQGRVMADWLNTNEFCILSLSRPGYLGTPLESGKTFEEQADLSALLLDELGIKKAFILGASASGPVLYNFALRHQEKCLGIVAIDCVSGYYEMPETAGMLAQILFLSDTGQAILNKLNEWLPEMFLKQLFKTEAYLTKRQEKKHIEYCLQNKEVMDFVKGFMKTISPWKLRQKGTENDLVECLKLTRLPVENINCPSLIIHGTLDADVKFYEGVYVYEHIQGAERFWIEEGSHIGFWISENGKKAQTKALDFLRRSL